MVNIPISMLQIALIHWKLFNLMTEMASTAPLEAKSYKKALYRMPKVLPQTC